MLPRARHRMRQFFGALRPRVTADDRAAAYGWLNPPLQRVFESMTVRDQQHGIEVYHRVQAETPDDAPLLVAALLHDCGKGHVLLRHRVAFVLVQAVAPSLVARSSSETGAGWRAAMWRLLHHPSLGADMAARAGAPADAVRLIRQQDASSADDRRLGVLQAADQA